MKGIAFVESTVGTIKSIYRRKVADGKALCVSIKLTNCKKVFDKDNHQDCSFKILVDDDFNKKLLSSIKKGNIVTIKEANQKVILIVKGEEIPPEGNIEIVQYNFDTRKRKKKKTD